MLAQTKRIIVAAALAFATGYTARWLTGREALKEVDKGYYRIPIEPVAFGDLTNDSIDDAIIRVRDFRERGKDTLLMVDGRYIVKIDGRYYITRLEEVHDTGFDFYSTDSIIVRIEDTNRDGNRDLVLEVIPTRKM